MCLMVVNFCHNECHAQCVRLDWEENCDINQEFERTYSRGDERKALVLSREEQIPPVGLISRVGKDVRIAARNFRYKLNSETRHGKGREEDTCLF